MRYIEYSRCETKGKECVDNGSADHQRTVCQNPDRAGYRPGAVHEDFRRNQRRAAGWERDYPGLHTYIDELLGFEGGYRGWRITPVNFDLAGRSKPKSSARTPQSAVIRYSYGKVVRQNKGTDYHQHTLEYPVKSREDWDRIKSRYLDPADPRPPSAPLGALCRDVPAAGLPAAN